MKITVEFELDDSFEAYHADDEQRLKALLRPNLDGVKTTIVKNLDLHSIKVSVCKFKDKKHYNCDIHNRNIYGCAGCVYEKQTEL